MKVRVAYKTIVEREIEVDEKYAECICLADLPWGDFPANRIDKWYEDCDNLYDDVREKLRDLDPDYDGIELIVTLDGGPIYS